MDGKREHDKNGQSGPWVSSYVLRDVREPTSFLLAGDRPNDAGPVPASMEVGVARQTRGWCPRQNGDGWQPIRRPSVDAEIHPPTGLFEP